MRFLAFLALVAGLALTQDVKQVAKSRSRRNTGCRNVKMELIFLVDGSNSVGYTSFDKMKAWIADFVKNFDLSESTTRVGLVQYSDRISTSGGYGFPLSGNAARVQSAVQNLEYLLGNTRTGEALDYAKTNVLRRARPGASQVVIVLTDGESQDEVKEAASALINDKAFIFAVGIGETVNTQQLRDIAGLPEYLHQIANYNAIEGITKQLYETLCKSVSSETCTASNQDIAFIIDGSSSIHRKDYDKVKKWIVTIVEGLEIGKGATQIAIMQFSGQSGRYLRQSEVLNFKDSTDKKTVIDRINNMRQMSGDTCIGEALDYFYRNMMTPQAGMREGVKKKVIMMTDGRKNCPMEIKPQADKIKQEGVTMYSIGVGHRCGAYENNGCYLESELQEIASKPYEKFVHEVDNFDSLILKRIGILGDVCEESSCPDAFIDVVLVVDGSGSIGAKRFELMKTWLKQVVDAFKVGENFARFAMVHYNKTNKIEFGIGDNPTNDQVSAAIDRVQYRKGGKTFTGKALEVAKGLFKHEDGRKEVMILLTDGVSDDGYKAQAAAIRDAGVDVFAVGVGNSKREELLEIAGNEDRVWKSRRFTAIDGFKQKMVKEMCVAAESQCTDQEVDLVFMLDSSGSIGSRNFEIAREWLISISKSFQIGPTATQIALIQYNQQPIPEFDLDDFATIEEVEEGFRRMKLSNGATNTGKALGFLNEVVFTEKYGARASAPKVLVILTDGQDATPTLVIEEARKLHQKDVIVFAIGVGPQDSLNMDLLGKVATEPVVEHIKSAATVEGINKFKAALASQICKEAAESNSCSASSMDLALVVDGSDSVGAADFEKLKNWAKSFIENLQVDKYGAKVGVIKYATSIKDVSPMSSDIEDIKRRIDRVSWIQGYTNTGAALERVRTKLFAEGGRENVPKVIVVVTDGESTDTEKLMSEAATLKEQGVLIYMVGVGEQIKQSELNAVATGKEFVYETRNYDSINQIKNSLLGRVCKEADEKSTGDCGDIAVDLQFIIDASSSVKAKNFIHSQSFAKNISNTFDLRHGDVRVGVLTYSSTVHDHQDIELGDPINGADDLNARIDAMPYEHGDTHTGAALRFIETNARWREEVPKILIFITDGRPQDRGQVPAAAQSLRDKGVRIFAIGVGDATEAELKEIASTPYEDHVIFISGADYSAVGQLRGYLENIVCREVEAISGGAQIADLDQGILTIRPAQPAKKEPDTQRFQNPAPGRPGPRNNAAGRYATNVVGQNYGRSQVSSKDTSRVAQPRVSTPKPKLPEVKPVPEVKPEPKIPASANVPPVMEFPAYSPIDESYVEPDPTQSSNLNSYSSEYDSGYDSDTFEPEVEAEVEPDEINQSQIPMSPSRVFGYATLDECPKFRRNGDIQSGADVLAAYGYNHQSAHVSGSRDHFRAYQIQGNQKIALTSVFPKGLTQVFSVIGIFNFGTSAPSSEKLIFQIIDGNKPYCSVGIKDNAISLVREGASDEISSSNYNNIFDGEFHKIQIFFDQTDVVFLLDCVQIARLPSLPSVNGVSPSAVIQSEGGIIIQDLSIICGLSNAEECCELENSLCGMKRISGSYQSTGGSFIMGGGGFSGGISSPSQSALRNGDSDSQCVCQPGPPGPAGPPGEPCKIDPEIMERLKNL